MLKGQIEIQVRDAQTLELEDSRIQSNIVLNTMFSLLSGSSSAIIPGKIVVTTKRLSPSRVASRVPSSTDTAVSSMGSSIPGRPSPEWFEKNGETPAFVQWCTRIDVPSRNRQINTIMLTDVATASTLNSNNSSDPNGKAYAYAKLASPCEQTTTQILDVYYRIYFPSNSANGLPPHNLAAIAKRFSGVITSQPGVYSRIMPVQFSHPPLKGDDAQNVMMQSWPYAVTYDKAISVDTTGWSSIHHLYKRKFTINLGLNPHPTGVLMSELATLSENWTVPGGVVTGLTKIPNRPNKIQNVFGRNTVPTGSVFLDIDNLPLGTGKVKPSGEWNNQDTPNAPGLFYSGKWPCQNYIQITQEGAVGVAQYKLRRRPFFGVQSAINPIVPVHALCTRVPSANLSLFRDLSKFTVRQLSAISKYDEASVVIPFKDSVMIYNLANSDYWRYTGGFTDIHQVAVVGGKVYLACRNTGLWVLDPKNSNTPTHLNAPAVGIDLSVCHGVAKGHNGSVWAVGNNGVVHFDGTTWSLYNELSTPAFNMPGVSNAKWSNIEYLKANAATAAGELLLVRKVNADVDATQFGVWWSLAGVASNQGTTLTAATSNAAGNPRVNRSHLACSEKDGLWVAAYNSAHRVLTFGSQTVSAAIGSLQYYNLAASYASVTFIPNASGADRILSVKNNSVFMNGLGTYYGLASVELRSPTNAIDAAILESDATVAHRSSLRLPNAPYESYAPHTVTTSGIGSASNAGDIAVGVHLGQGIVFSMLMHETNQTEGGFISSHLTNFTLNRISAGPLQHVTFKDYGWDGTAWVENHTGAKVTHVAPQPLIDGVSLEFSDGTSGTSFVLGESYNFALAEGLFKDNATTNLLEIPYYFKKNYPNTAQVSSNTIPLTANTSQTGVVGPDLSRCNSLDFTMNASNQVVFSDENGQQRWIGDKELVGDFKVTWTLANIPEIRDVFFGIGVGDTHLQGGWVIDDVGTIWVNYVDQAGNWRFVSTKLVNGSSVAIGTKGTVTTLGVARVGTQQYQFLVDDVVITPNSGGGTSLPAFAPAGRTRHDVICTPFDTHVSSRQIANRTVPQASIISNGADNAIKIGTALDNTGAFNPKFMAIDTDLRGGIVATIAGVPALVKTDYSAPAVGEVSLDYLKGSFIFNPTDEGKAFSVNCTYLTHE